MKRQIEIFTAGCPVCEPVVQMVRETACQNCEITVYDFTNKADEGDWHQK